jgi:hypothetical protein
VGTQLADNGGRQGDRSRLPGLGFLVSHPGFRLLGTLHDGKPALIEVNRAPADGGNLASAHPAQNRQQRRHMHPGTPQGIQQVGRFCEGVGEHLSTLDLGRLDVGRWVVWEEPPSDGLPKGGAQYPVTVKDRSRR